MSLWKAARCSDLLGNPRIDGCREAAGSTGQNEVGRAGPFRWLDRPGEIWRSGMALFRRHRNLRFW